MQYRMMTDADWAMFEAFARRNFVRSHPVSRTFNEYWFRFPDGTWNVQLALRDDGSLAGVNMMVDVPGRILDVRTPLTWMGTILVEEDAQAQGAGGALALWAHRKRALVGCTCANPRSLPLNDSLGFDFHGVGIRRFVRPLTERCLAIVRDESRATVAAAITALPPPGDPTARHAWVAGPPDDFEPLWAAFSQRFAVVVERDLAYMRRRYVTSPFQSYDFLEIRGATEALLGFAVVRFHPTPAGACARIVDFAALPGAEEEGWRRVLAACAARDALYADFFVMGTAQDEAMQRAGLILATEENGFEDVPNLLAPIDYRRWSYTFHLSGTLPRRLDGWRDPALVWFTKGDDDRDWPTSDVVEAWERKEVTASNDPR